MQVSPTDLAAFPGAPFVQEHINAVVAKLERALGWHVAPSKEETLTVRAGGDRMLVLPSRKVTAVAEVRSGGAVVSSGDYVLTGAAEAMLEGYWSGTYEVDVTHGFETVPADLLGEIAAACVAFRTDPSLAAWSSGPFSATLRGPGQGAGPSSTFYAYSVNLGV
ncbi:hypothetical protein [Agromyces sp. NPDC058064]|uniref:hypothetical protein n=1 Tax=Agromyces sp. NPDC058064 TaxID=3346322 RepID=UPI0036D9A6D1